MRVKICGLTQVDQAQAIAQIGIQALGFICVPSSKRYVSPEQLRRLTASLPPFVARIGVFADLPLATLLQLVPTLGLSGVQLHGQESPAYCAQVRQALAGYEVIKALRLQHPDQLDTLESYYPQVSAVLLDAYQSQQLGGTGQVLDWQSLAKFRPPIPWILAGGLNPENVLRALRWLQPAALDLSSGVETAPGDKNLAQVRLLWEKLHNPQTPSTPDI